MSDDTAATKDDGDTQTQDASTSEGSDTSDSGGSMTGALPDADDMSQEELDEIEAERERRTAPENRPDGAEVDNTDREFDPVQGQFTDSEPDPDLGPFPDPSEEVG
jgi:hypothetical protein